MIQAGLLSKIIRGNKRCVNENGVVSTMKKHVKIEYILILATMVFAAFTAGYFLGRNNTHAVMTQSEASVTVEKLEQAEAALQAEETTGAQTPDSLKKTVSGSRSGLVNINIATQEELETLPGIGEELADRIIEHRKMIGGFREKSDICSVPGIGEKKYEAIQSLITVG